jgi:hypothetical protein
MEVDQDFLEDKEGEEPKPEGQSNQEGELQPRPDGLFSEMVAEGADFGKEKRRPAFHRRSLYGPP